MEDKYVVVGFKVNEANSVHYAKADTLEKCLKQIEIAFKKKGAEFISLRRIPQD